MINRADRYVRATHPSCRPRCPHGRVRLVDGGAGPQVASVLGVFRRPPTGEERAFAAQALTGPGGAALFGGGALGRDAVRIVHSLWRAADGSVIRRVPRR